MLANSILNFNHFPAPPAALEMPDGGGGRGGRRGGQ
jgi:hypothetical protein